MADRFFIAPYEENSGLQTSLKPWLIPDEAFAELNNAYVFRGRVRKRFGSRWIGDNSLVSRLRINVGFITGGALSGNIKAILADLGIPIGIGQSFSIGDIIFTVYNPAIGPQQMLRSDNSIATATSDAVPTPASTIIGIFILSIIIFIFVGLSIPSPEPIGAPSGITQAAPASSNRRAVIKSSVVYGKTVKPSLTRSLVASRSSCKSG